MYQRSFRWLAVAAILVAVVTIGGQGATAQDASPVPLEQITGTTYVGATSNPDLFVAVVLGDVGEVRAYLCDGAGISEWLTGTTTDGATLDLVSANGATLEATISDTGVQGSATLADGTSVTFEAVPAQGIGGLYTSEISDDRRVRGTSSTGASLDGVIADRPTSANGQTYQLAGFLTPADGAPVAFVVSLTGPDAPDEARSITLNDGQQRGKSKSAGRVWVTDPM